jgi:hypothetical protein
MQRALQSSFSYSAGRLRRKVEFKGLPESAAGEELSDHGMKAMELCEI